MIRIDVPDIVSYAAGSKVSGTVSIDQVVAANVQNVSISLQGHSQTEINNLIISTRFGTRGTKDCRGRVTLFRQHLDLFNAEKAPPEQSTWPFNFTFPSCCDPAHEDISALGRFTLNSNTHHSLPPSCSDMIFKSGSNFRYLIYYELVACLEAKHSSMPPIRASQRLTYLSSARLGRLTTRPEFVGHRIECQSVLLPAKYPREAVRPRTLGERIGLKSVIPDAGPMATFWIRAMVPTVAAVNGALPLVLSISHDTEFSTTSSPPVVFLKHVKALLTAKPEIRCDRGHQMADWTQYHTVIDHTYLKPITITENMELMDFKLKHSLIPSFNSFIVRMTHALVIELTIECAQKTFVNTFQTDDEFVLLAEAQPFEAQPLRAMAPGLPSIGVLNTMPQVSSDTEPPPPYEP